MIKYLATILVCFMPTMAWADYRPPYGGGATSVVPGTDVTDTDARADAGTILRRLGAHFSDTYDVQNFGAYCDGRELTDAATTGSNPVISSPSYQFTAADVGSYVDITSMNNDAIINTSQIISVSSGNATLANNSLFTGSNLRLVMYAHDDTAAIQAATNYVNGAILPDGKALTGGYLHFPSGVCAVTGITSQKRQVIYAGEGRNASLIYLIRASNAPVIKSESFSTLTGTGANYGTNSAVPSWFGLKNIRIDGNSVRQSVANDCVDYYGNAQIIDGIMIQHCAQNGLWTEASGTFAYDQFDWKAQEEGFINDLIIRNTADNGWVMRGPHDSIVTSVLIYDWGHSGAGYGFKSEFSGALYSGSAHFWHLHPYAAASGVYTNIYIGSGNSDFQFLYSDLGTTTIASSNNKINTMFMLGCGVGSASPCLDFTTAGDFNTISILNFSWYFGGTPANITAINIPSGADNNTINQITGSSVVNSAANGKLLSVRGAFNKIGGAFANTTGTGSICADVGGSYNYYDMRSFGCKTHVNDPGPGGGSHDNQVSDRSFLSAGETAFAGTVDVNSTYFFDAADISNSTFKRFTNLAGGSAAFPALTFGGGAAASLTTGIYGDASNVNLAVAGTRIAGVNASGLTVQQGTVTAGVAGTTAGHFVMAGSTTGATTLQTPASTTTHSLTLPATAGITGQILKYTSTGVLDNAADNTGAGNMIDITASPYNAVGDDSTDNCTGIQAAFDANPLRTIFFPISNGVGIYRSSCSIVLTNDTGKDFQGSIFSDGAAVRFTNAGSAADTDANMQNGFVAYPTTNGPGGDTSGWSTDDNQATMTGLTIIGPRHGAAVHLGDSIGVVLSRIHFESVRYGIALESTINIHLHDISGYDWTNAGIGMIYSQNPDIYYGVSPPSTIYNDNVRIEQISLADGPTDGTGACILDTGSSAERTRFISGVSCQGKTGNTGVQYGYLARNVQPNFQSNWFEAIDHTLRIISSNAAEGGSGTLIPGITAFEPTGTLTVGDLPDGFCTGGVFFNNYSAGAVTAWQPDCNGQVTWGGNFTNGTTGTDLKLAQASKRFMYLGDTAGSGSYVINNSFGGFYDLSALGATPSVSSGFGTGPSTPNNNSASSFTVNVGTGGTANSGVIGFSSAAIHGWACTCTDTTTRSSNVAQCLSTPTSTTSVTLRQYDTTMAAHAWVASDILSVQCSSY